jgi:dTDP-4-dehydrorhamnose 3,5-epimerase-like enzyme
MLSKESVSLEEATQGKLFFCFENEVLVVSKNVRVAEKTFINFIRIFISNNNGA